MPTVCLQGTKFKFDCLPPKLLSGEKVFVLLSVQNDHMDYCDFGRALLLPDFESWLFGMYRLLAGAYSSPYSLSFERVGIAVDFFPYSANARDGRDVSREERRKNDCTMAVRLLMRSADKRRFLGGVYTLIFHRDDIKKFADGLREEFYENYAKLVQGRGKYRFVGVSPLGYEGCNYWYLDESDSIDCGDCVWVRMGKRQTEQIVYVDSVRRFTEENAPYDPACVKKVLRKATKEEIEKVKR